MMSGDTNAPIPNVKCSALIHVSVDYLGWTRMSATVSKMLMNIIIMPMKKQAAQNNRKLSVPTMATEHNPTIAQAAAIILLILTYDSSSGATKQPSNPPIPLTLNAHPRSVYFISSSFALNGTSGPIPPATKPNSRQVEQ